MQALFYNLLRLVWPHNGVLLAAIARSLGLSRAPPSSAAALRAMHEAGNGMLVLGGLKLQLAAPSALSKALLLCPFSLKCKEQCLVVLWSGEVEAQLSAAP